MVIVVMGPSGSGKTTVGTRLAAELGWPFHDGDDFHPPENVARMRAGLALGDPERAPWLAALGALVARTVAAGRSAVLACSALRQGYRRTLAAGVPEAARPAAVRFVYLRADEALLAERLARRPGALLRPGAPAHAARRARGAGRRRRARPRPHRGRGRGPDDAGRHDPRYARRVSARPAARGCVPAPGARPPDDATRTSPARVD
jgi:gluconokinase